MVALAKAAGMNTSPSLRTMTGLRCLIRTDGWNVVARRVRKDVIGMLAAECTTGIKLFLYTHNWLAFTGLFPRRHGHHTGRWIGIGMLT